MMNNDPTGNDECHVLRKFHSAKILQMHMKIT